MVKQKNTNKQDNVVESKPATAPVKLTEGELIWNEIKDKHLNMFSLSNQRVADYCQPVVIEPSKCFLLFKAGAVLPALEEAVGKRFSVEAMDKYIVITRK